MYSSHWPLRSTCIQINSEGCRISSRSMEKNNLYYSQQELYKLVRTTFPFKINMFFEDGHKENSHWQTVDTPASGELCLKIGLVQSVKNHTLLTYCTHYKFCTVNFWCTVTKTEYFTEQLHLFSRKILTEDKKSWKIMKHWVKSDSILVNWGLELQDSTANLWV